jgi:lysozyme
MKLAWIKSLVTAIAVFAVLGCGGNNDTVTTIQAPSITPAGGAYSQIFRIALTTANAGDEIRYTLDNTAPTLTSTKYILPIPVADDGANVTIRAITVRNGSQTSTPSTASWTLQYAYNLASQSISAGASLTEGVIASKVNGTIDWASVKAYGIDFAFIRAAAGTTIDTNFAANWSAAKTAGVLRAPLQFFEPTQDPVAQANTFLAEFAVTSGDLPPVIYIDVTDASLTAAQYAGKIAQWVARVEEVTGLVPIVATGPAFWNDSLDGCTAFGNLPLSISHFGVASPLTPNAWTIWKFWHYTMTGIVGGMPGNVDRVHFNGTLTDLQGLLI